MNGEILMRISSRIKKDIAVYLNAKRLKLSVFSLGSMLLSIFLPLTVSGEVAYEYISFNELVQDIDTVLGSYRN
jgi:hypothetical protein